MSNPATTRKHHPVLDVLKYIGIGVIAILLIVLFTRDPGLSRKAPPIGSVNGVNIYYERGSRFAEIYNNYQQQYSRYGDLTRDDYKRIQYMAFREAANEIILEQVADDYGIKVSPKYIASNVRMYPEFWEAGVFMKERFEQALQMNAAGIIELEKRIEKERKRELLQYHLFSRYVATIPAQEDGEEPERRRIFAYEITSLDLSEAFVRQNTTRKIALVFVNASNRVLTKTHPEADLRAFYEERKLDFVQYDLYRIVCSNKTVAQSIYSELMGTNAEAFAAYAKAMSIEEDERDAGGKLGFVSKRLLQRELYPLLETNAESILFRPIPYGFVQGMEELMSPTYAVYFLKEKRIPAFEEIMAERVSSESNAPSTLEAAYVEANFDTLLKAEKDALAAQLLPAIQKVQAGVALRTVAAELSLPVYESGYFPYDVEGSIPSAGEEEEEFLEMEGEFPVQGDSALYYAAFSTPVGGVSSNLVEFSMGYGLIEVLDARMPTTNDWDEQNRARMVNNLKTTKTILISDEWLNQQKADIVYKQGEEQAN